MKRQIRILLMDKGLREASFFQKNLSKHGYKVDVDINPQETLGKLNSKKYDVIILDASVSQGNGLCILDRIHSEHPEERVIVVSASPSWREGKEAYSKGAIDYISKSFDEVSLLNSLREGLEKPIHSFTRK